jgi:hypothetical protein
MFAFRVFLRGGFSAATLLIVATSFAQTWDVARDVSWSMNPNGVWSYGYTPTATTGNFALLTRLGAGYGWYHFPGTSDPAIITTTYSGATQGFLGFHPGGNISPQKLACCVRWTAPSNGVYAIQVVFAAPDSYWLIGQNLGVRENGSVRYQGTLQTKGESHQYSDTLTLTNGSTIDVAVFNQPAVDNNVTHVAFSVTATNPPPAQPRLSIRLSQVELCWPTDVNTWYQLQVRSSVTLDEWQPMTPDWITGTGETYCTFDAIGAGDPKKFYRVIQTNAPPVNP